MLKHKRLTLFLLLLLLFGFTWLCADHFVADKPRTFWYLLGGIWSGELLLGLTVISIPRPNDRTLPLRLGELFANLLYMLFVLLMVIPFHRGSLSSNGFLLWELGGLFAMLLMHCLFVFALRDADDLDAVSGEKLSDRRSLRDELERLRFAKRHLAAADPKIDAAFEKLKEDARFMLNDETVSDRDHEIRLARIEIENADSPEEVIRAVDKLRDLLRMLKNTAK